MAARWSGGALQPAEPLDERSERVGSIQEAPHGTEGYPSARLPIAAEGSYQAIPIDVQSESGRRYQKSLQHVSPRITNPPGLFNTVQITCI